MSKKILLVDDEDSIRESLSKVLRGESYEIELAANGGEAVGKCAAEPFALVILDLDLKVKDGWSIVERLAKINPLLPVIAITGRSDQRPRAENAGVDALMEKPLDVPCLLRTIGELLTESIETRVCHASDRASRVRYAPNQSRVFEEMLLKRLTTPFRYHTTENP